MENNGKDDCDQMAQLRKVMDLTVEQLIKKVDAKTFKDNAPSCISKGEVERYHSSLVKTLRSKLNEMVEDHLSGSDFNGKLSKMQEIKQMTPQSNDHRAWRPPFTNTVSNCLLAHDLKVTEQSAERLDGMLAELENEVDQLEHEIASVCEEMSANNVRIAARHGELSRLTAKLEQNCKSEDGEL